MDLEAVRFAMPPDVDVQRAPSATLVLGPRGAQSRNWTACANCARVTTVDAPPRPQTWSA